MSILAEHRPITAIVDKGDRGVEIEGVRILRSGQKRGITRTLKAMIHRRSAAKPAKGHMKMDGRWVATRSRALWAARCTCGAGHNLRLILAKLRLLCARLGLILRVLLATFSPPASRT